MTDRTTKVTLIAEVSQYLAGMEHTAPQSAFILEQMIQESRYPTRIFVGLGRFSTELRWAVRQRLRAKKG